MYVNRQIRAFNESNTARIGELREKKNTKNISIYFLIKWNRINYSFSTNNNITEKNRQNEKKKKHTTFEIVKEGKRRKMSRGL